MLRLTLLLAALALPASAEEVVVFAAASLKSALDPIAEAFQQDTGAKVTISYAGSNTLAKQILEGAPADIFLSASSDWMTKVAEGGEVGAQRELLGNTLVLVASQPEVLEPVAGFDLAGALKGGKLAMALVDSVPAGQYGKEALTTLGVWQAVEPSVAQADNVRAALALVASGEAPFGVVYGSDAKAEPKVHVAGVFPESSHKPITYPVALLKTATDPADRTFYDALSAPAAKAVFAAQGFMVRN